MRRRAVTSTPRTAPPGGPAERGQSTVELALVLPVVVLLLLAVLQIGLVARDIVLVTHACREAARAASVDDDPAAPRRAAIAAGGLDEERLAVAVSGRDGPGSRARVVVTYDLPQHVPIVSALLGKRTLHASATMRVEGPAP